MADLLRLPVKRFSGDVFSRFLMGKQYTESKTGFYSLERTDNLQLTSTFNYDEHMNI